MKYHNAFACCHNINASTYPITAAGSNFPELVVQAPDVGHADLEWAKLFDQLRSPHKPSAHINWQRCQLLIDAFIEGFNRPSVHGGYIKKEIFTN
jgi:hypothetical protein